MQIRTYTFTDAARISGVPEEELRSAFKDGLIMARSQENTGLYHIDEQELDRYLRRSRNQELTAPLRRILVIDDDIRYAESLVLGLQRDARLEGRTATWGKDAIGLLHRYKPNLTLLGWRTPDDALEAVVEVLTMRSLRRQTRIMAYGSNTERAKATETSDSSLNSLGIPGALYSKARGLDAQVADCYPHLGLELPSSLNKPRTIP